MAMKKDSGGNTGTWKKGQSGNPAGKPKGTKNNFQKMVKQYIKRITGYQLERNLEKDLEAMTPEGRWRILLAMNKFTMKEPTQKIKHKITGIDVSWGEPENKIEYPIQDKLEDSSEPEND